MNIKQGIKIGGIFAIFGFLFGLPIMNSLNPLNMPGLYILRILWSDWEIGHGGFLFNILTNTFCYAIAGFLIGLFSKSGNMILIWVGVFVLSLCSYYFFIYTLPSYKLNQNIMRQLRQEVDDRLAKDPNDVYALHWMGVHHLTRTGNYKEAEKYFKKVVDIQSLQKVYS
jgi:hypothetical protein